jgi:hypothetical protein
VSGAFDAHPQNLQNLITTFNTTAAAFAAQSANLQKAVAELPKTLQVATPALSALNAAFPPLRALARALIPGVQSAGPAIDASLPFVTQLRLLVQPSELRGLTRDLAGTVPSLAKLTKETIPLMRDQVRPASSCAVGQLLPWSRLSINDPNFNASNGFPSKPTYAELPSGLLPGLSGESRNFDANGPYFRVLGMGGTYVNSLSPGMFGTAIYPIDGIQPVPPVGDKHPPIEAGVPCETQQAITSLASPVGPGPPQVASAKASPAGQALQQALRNEATALLSHDIKQQGFPYKLAGAAK